MLLDLLKDRRELALGPGAMLLGGFALDDAPALLDAIAAVAVLAPFRHMETPGGWRMSVAMTTCGAAGWTTSRRGYRYTPDGPVSDRPWPAMPDAFLDVARRRWRLVTHLRLQRPEKSSGQSSQPPSTVIQHAPDGPRTSSNQFSRRIPNLDLEVNNDRP
jgi:alkylated DNA repair dioxygenase AlkB